MRPPSLTAGYGAAAPRRESFARRLMRFVRRLCLLVLGAGLIAAGFFGARAIHQFVTGSGYFKIREIRIDGASEALEREARAWLSGPLARANQNLCLVRDKALAAGLRTLARVKAARVRKLFPQTLVIELQERQPIAVANLGQPYLIDAEGAIIAEADPAALQRLALPIVTGIRGEQHHPGQRLRQARLADILAAIVHVRDHEPLLQKKIVEWNLNGREEITAILATRTEVRFGDQAPLELLGKLACVLPVKKELERATYIDLRMERQIVYK